MSCMESVWASLNCAPRTCVMEIRKVWTYAVVILLILPAARLQAAESYAVVLEEVYR